jgi:glycosyltransferase involved in cell wall biosynthesis
MYAGNLDAYQDLAVLGPAFNLFRQHVAHALLVVVTHESGWRRRIPAELRRLCEDGAMQVVVAPSFASVRGWMRQADVLVCPRSSWSGYPIKLLNYLAARRPVVAARSSAKGLADGVHGLLFDNGDARGLADALRALHADESLAERLVWGATQLLGSLPTWNQAAANVEEIYHTLLGTGCPRPLSEARDGTYLKGLPVISTNRISALADRVG